MHLPSTTPWRFHSNDVEGENARLKSWLRAHLHISVTDREDPDDASLFSHSFSRDMSEYCFDVSVGKSFRDAMRGLAVAAGGSFTPFRVSAALKR